MKMVIAVIRPEKLEDVKEALRNEGVKGMTFTHVTGRGEQAGIKFTNRVGEFIVDEIEKVKIESVMEDSQVRGAIEAIRSSAYTGHHGDGRIFVVPIEESYKISDYRNERFRSKIHRK